MNRLNNKGQVLVLFICLLPIMIMIIGVVVDVSSMVINKKKLDNTNEIAIGYYNEHLNDVDVTDKLINLVKKNDNMVINIKIDKDKKRIYMNKKIESTFGKIIGILEYEIVSEYGIFDNDIKRVR